jgi:hypothetical protein
MPLKMIFLVPLIKEAMDLRHIPPAFDWGLVAGWLEDRLAMVWRRVNINLIALCCGRGQAARFWRSFCKSRDARVRVLKTLGRSDAFLRLTQSAP